MSYKLYNYNILKDQIKMKAIEQISILVVFAFMILETFAINYPGDPGCDPRCADSNCDVLSSY